MNRRRRAVHYTAAGSRGLSFDCYYQELNAHLDSKKEETTSGSDPAPWFSRKITYGVLGPRCSTNLDRVTCRNCWLEIARLAHERLK